MKSILRQTATGALVFLAWIAQAADPIGSVVGVEGVVTAQTAGQDARALTLKSDLYLGDTLATGAGAKVQILFLDDSIFAQGENAEVVLDEFVYDPKKPASNTLAVRASRGAFRAISGRITDLNPDRFKVKTGRATIGVRGCEVAFVCTEQQDEFLVSDPGIGQGVLIVPLVGSGRKQLLFFEPGRGVIEEGGRVFQGDFDPTRFLAILDAVTPLPKRSDSPAGGASTRSSGGNGLLPPKPGPDPQPGAVARLDGGILFQDPKFDLGAPVKDSGSTPGVLLPPRQWVYSGYAGAIAIDPMYPMFYSTYSSLNDLYMADEMDEQAVMLSQKPFATPPADMSFFLFDTPYSSVYSLSLGTPDSVILKGGDRFTAFHTTAPNTVQTETYPGGEDWVWGEWSGTQDIYGTARQVNGIFVAGRALSGTEFDAVRNGSTSYSLVSSPMGSAHAWITNMSAVRNLTGTANLSVMLGTGTAVWGGQFDLSNGLGDTLSITVSSMPLSAGGHLTGTPTAYSLFFNGSPEGAPIQSLMSGSLVGPGPNGDGKPPVTGAIGSGRFDHGNGTIVILNYGTDLK